LAPAGAKNINFGWKIKEGTLDGFMLAVTVMFSAEALRNERYPYYCCTGPQQEIRAILRPLVPSLGQVKTLYLSTGAAKVGA
jgi:hypothetical protein